MDIFRSASRQSTHVIRVPEFAGTAYGIKPSHDQSGYQLHSLSPLRPETAFHFSDPSFEDPAYIPPESNNSAWARARRSPVIHATWKDAPTLSELWTFAYTVFTLQPKLEQFRLNLKLECTTAEIDKYLALIYDTGFAIPHPNPAAPPGQPVPTCERHKGELVVYRSSFWQGAGSSSCQPAWINPLLAQASFPPRPLQYTITTGFADARVHAQHPIRPPKPEPASMIYSRWIPHLDEMFSMIALDFTDAKHLQYFHEWQNSPRVAAGWNETGTLEEHREYLRRIHEDPHQFAVLGQFDGVPFAYFEIYWTKVCQYSSKPRNPLTRHMHPPILTYGSTGGPRRRILQRRRLRSRAALPSREREVPGATPGQSVAYKPDALHVPGRSADERCGWGAAGNGSQSAGVRPGEWVPY